jgi:hypothetical protein
MAARDRGGEHAQQDALEKGALEKPGDEKEQKEKGDNRREVAPVGEEPGGVLDGAAGMGGDPADYGMIEKE